MVQCRFYPSGVSSMAGASKIMKSTSKGQEAPLSAKLELFCRNYVNSSMTANAAYIAAGFVESANPRTLIKRVNTALKDPRVIRKIAELEAKKYKKVELTAERIEKEYMAIAFAKISDAVEWGEIDIPVGQDSQGKVITRSVFYVKPKSVDDMTEDTLISIKEISMSNNGAIKVTMHDKMAALNVLSRRYKRFQERQAQVEALPSPDAGKYTEEDLKVLKGFFDAEF